MKKHAMWKSRREFLKQTTLSGAGITIFGLNGGNHQTARSPSGSEYPTPEYSKMVKLNWLSGKQSTISSGVRFGVPWAQNSVKKNQELVIKSADGKSIPAQHWPLAFWPDGSVKWSGVGIAATTEFKMPLTLAAGKNTQPTFPIQVREESQFIEVLTGAIECRIGKHGAHILQSIFINGKEVGRDGRLVAIKEDRSEYLSKRIIKEVVYDSNINNVTVEQLGPVSAVVKIQGNHVEKNNQNTWLPFTLRLYFTAGLTSIRLVHSFVFDGDEKVDFIKGLGLVFNVPFREEKQNRHIRFSGEGQGLWSEPVLMSPGYRPQLVKEAVKMNQDQMLGKRIPNLSELGQVTKEQFETIALWDSFELTQLSPDFFSISKRTNNNSSWLHAADGHRSRGFVFLGDVSGGLAVGVRRFWEKYPAALEINGAIEEVGELKIWLWSPAAPAMDLRHYDIIGHDGKISYEDHEPGSSTPFGIANTSEITLWALDNTPMNATLADMAEISNEPPLLVCTPEHYHSIPVFGSWSLPDRSTQDKAEMEDQLNRAWNFFAKEIEQRSWYGFWDFGDFMRTYSTIRHEWLYDIGGHAWNNTELMSDAWLWYTFLRTGRKDAFRLAEAMTRHTSEVDVYHMGRFAGIGSRHNVKHWGDGAKELRISEAYLKRFYYYLTADERIGDLMREVLTADLNIKNALPLRKGVPRPDIPVVLRSGPDWIALASNWMTEWERTGDLKYRDYVLAGMKSIGAMPEVFLNRLAMGFDLKTKKLYDIGEPNLKTYEFIVLFGGDHIALELIDLIDCPEFTSTWKTLCYKWAHETPGPSSNARITAYMSKISSNPELGRKAWQLIRDSLKENGRDRFPANMTIIEGPSSLKRVEEIAGVNTPGAAQWALNIITATELAKEFYTSTVSN